MSNPMLNTVTRAAYEAIDGDAAILPSEILVFTRDDDGPCKSLYCTKAEAAKFELDMADGEPPLLNHDTLSEQLFDKFVEWLQKNEGNVKTLDEWFYLDRNLVFVLQIQDRYREAFNVMTANPEDIKQTEKVAALLRVANLYGIKL